MPRKKNIPAFLCSIFLLSCSTAGKTPEFSLEKVENGSIVLLQTDAVIKNGHSNQAIIYRYAGSSIHYKDKSIIYFEGPITGEYIVIRIVGSILRVDHIATEWDGFKLREKGMLHSFSDLKNQILILNTYFAESSPNDMVRITDINGRAYDLLIRETDLR